MLKLHSCRWADLYYERLKLDWSKVVRFGEPGYRLPVMLAVLVGIFSWMSYYSLTRPAEHKPPVEQHITGSLQLAVAGSDSHADQSAAPRRASGGPTSRLSNL